MHVVAFYPCQLNCASIRRSGEKCDDTASACSSTALSSAAASPTSLRVLVPDEATAAIVARSVPAHPGLTARDVCKIVAHKMGITNPEDFALFTLSGGTGECEIAGETCTVHCTHISKIVMSFQSLPFRRSTDPWRPEGSSYLAVFTLSTGNELHWMS